MTDILQFKQLKHSGKDHVESLRADVAALLIQYPMSQIVLALFECARLPDDVAAIIPSFSKVVLDNEKK